MTVPHVEKGTGCWRTLLVPLSSFEFLAMIERGAMRTSEGMMSQDYGSSSFPPLVGFEYNIWMRSDKHTYVDRAEGFSPRHSLQLSISLIFTHFLLLTARTSSIISFPASGRRFVLSLVIYSTTVFYTAAFWYFEGLSEFFSSTPHLWNGKQRIEPLIQPCWELFSVISSFKKQGSCT